MTATQSLEKPHRRSVALADAGATRRDAPGTHRAAAEPSVSSALERLGAAGQSVIAKRIDLAMLEGQELLSRTLAGAALIGAGTLLAAAAWFAVAAGFSVWLIPAANPIVRLAVIGLLNGTAALGLVALGMRRGRPQRPVRLNGSALGTPAEP